MKHKSGIIGMLISVVLLSGCSSYETKTYVLEDTPKEEESLSYMNLDRIYDYCYNISTYGNEDLAESKSAWWSGVIDRRIALNQYNYIYNTNYINIMDYEYGVSEESAKHTWNSYDKPLGMSPDCQYMFYIRDLSDARYLMLYDYWSKEDILIARYDPKIVPEEYFEPAFCWSDNGSQLIYGWKYTGESQHVVALDEDYYYNDWRYSKESVYSIQSYSVAKKVSTPIYELTYWKYHDKIYNYDIQLNSNGYAMIYSKDDRWLYLINTLNLKDQKTINQFNLNCEKFWLGNKGIYAQDTYYNLQIYRIDGNEWELEVDDVHAEVKHLITSKDGNILYFSVRQDHETYADRKDSNGCDIFCYIVDQERLECMYQGAEDLIAIDLSHDEKNLMLEMRDTSYQNRYNNSLITRLLVFKSYTQGAEE